MTGQALILRGDARALPLPDASVDLIVTSPPFYALRSYTDGGEHYDGQIGSEATPGEYIAALIDCTREWMRVLKPTGSLFVDLGDKYDSGTTAGRVNPGTVKDGKGQGWHQGTPRMTTGRPKSLLLLPERYRIAAVDQLGLIARAVIVWEKVNGLPESVTDRVRRSHEDWVHLVKQPRYYSAVDEIREPHVEPNGRPAYGRTRPPAPGGNRGLHVERGSHADYRDMGQNPLGKLPGSVWSIPSEPLTVPRHLGIEHFAAFPSEWPRRLIAGWSPPGICVECGEGRRPVASVEYVRRQNDRPGARIERNGDNNRNDAALPYGSSALRLSAIVGYACACPTSDAPTRPAVVLDPFGGTGTTALAATALGRVGITVDRSADYCRLAQWRTSDPGQVAKVLGVPKPPVQADGQLDLFGAVA